MAIMEMIPAELLGYVIAVAVGAGVAYYRTRKVRAALEHIVGAIESAPPRVSDDAKHVVESAARRLGVNESVVDPVVQRVVEELRRSGRLTQYARQGADEDISLPPGGGRDERLPTATGRCADRGGCSDGIPPRTNSDGGGV